MPEHVAVNREGKAGTLANTLDQPIDGVGVIVRFNWSVRAMCARATLSDFTGYEDAGNSGRREPESDLVAPRTLARWWRGCGG
jgi:hypothetical protein